MQYSGSVSYTHLDVYKRQALDNRPLNFEEFEGKIDQMLLVSASPNKYENEHELLRA